MNIEAKPKHINRREFIKLSSSSVAVLAGGISAKDAFGLLRKRKPKPKNILVIFTDQQHIDTIAATGCRYVRTPALDELARSGVSFSQSYSPNPLCSPARSAVFTGRTSSEAHVHVNGRPIRSDIPNLGQWFSQHTDYEAVYAGKWHLPRSYTSNIPGFKVIPIEENIHPDKTLLPHHTLEPKIRAAIMFLEGIDQNPAREREVIITLTETALKALEGKTGTRITR